MTMTDEQIAALSSAQGLTSLEMELLEEVRMKTCIVWGVVVFLVIGLYYALDGVIHG